MRYQPHDRFVNGTLSDLNVAREFFRLFLPPAVTSRFDWQTLQMEDRTFVNAALQVHRTDLLFTTRDTAGQTTQIYLLFEHKSQPDSRLPLQLLRYMTEIYDIQKTPAPVLAIVLYHGPEAWQVARSFQDYLELTRESPYRDHTLDFEYTLVDVSLLDLDDWKGSLLLGVFLRVLRDIHLLDDPNRLEEFVRFARDLLMENPLEFIQRMYVYMYGARDVAPEALQAVLGRVVNEEAAQMAQTTAERLHQEGKLEGKLEDARNMAREGIAFNVIQRVTGLSAEELSAGGVSESPS